MNFVGIARAGILPAGLAMTLLLCACESRLPDNSGFVRTVNFSELQTYRYKHTLTTGLEWREADRLLLEELSPRVLAEALVGRGFEAVESGEDILAVVKWRKSASAYRSPFDAVDGPIAELVRRDGTPGFSTRISLVVELYEEPEGELFWEKELRNAFDAIRLTGDRIERTLQKSIETFPGRVERDPGLPSIR